MIGFRHSKEDIKKTLDMAWPAMLESFFAAFAGLVDSLMVSSLGSYAVAAVGLTTQPKFLGLSLFIASNVAISALVARRKGEDKKEEANKIFSTFLVFLLAAAVLMSIVLVVFADPIIRLCGSEELTHDSAVTYFRIIMGGDAVQCASDGHQFGTEGRGQHQNHHAHEPCVQYGEHHFQLPADSGTFRLSGAGYPGRGPCHGSGHGGVQHHEHMVRVEEG